MSKNTSMLENELRWGMVGCGSVAQVKSAPCYQKVAGFKLAGVTNRTISKAQSFASQNKIEHIFENAKALVNSNHIDAVYIATPPDSHLELAKLVAESGKPCCIEKPLAPSYSECRVMVELFENKKLPLFVAYYRRSLPRFLQIKSWLQQNQIGEVRHVQWNYYRPPSKEDLSGQANWRTDKDIAYAGYFDDLASHGLNLFEYLLGDITDAKGSVLNQQSLYTAADAVTGTWIHEDRISGAGFWNFAAGSFQDEVRLVGSKGEILFSVFDEKPVRLYGTKKQEELFIDNPENVQFFHVENMRVHLSGGEQHPSLGHSAARTAWVMDKICGKL